jgi:hypothetical protein
MNQYKMFFVQTSTLSPRMHQKLAKHGNICKQNNQLPTKNHDELEDNSIVCIGLGLPTPIIKDHQVHEEGSLIIPLSLVMRLKVTKGNQDLLLGKAVSPTFGSRGLHPQCMAR